MEEGAQELFEKGLKSIIETVLPTLPSTAVEEVATLLTKAGVEKEEDLQYVTEDDLKDSVLKAIHIRKLIIYAKGLASSPIAKNTSSSRNDNAPNGIPSSLISTNDGSSFEDEFGPSRASCSKESTGEVVDKYGNENWAVTYKIKLDIFTKQVQKDLLSNNALSCKSRGIVIRTLVDDAIKKCIRPTYSNMRKLSKHFMNRFPNALVDKIGDKTIGLGDSLFVKQLYNRLDYLSRQETGAMPRVKKIKKFKPPRLEIKNTDSFNCNPESSEENLKTCETLRKELLELHFEMNPDKDVVEIKMRNAYALQRHDINEGMDLEEIKARWPFLFETTGMRVHLEQLLGYDLIKKFTDFFKEKTPLFLQFFSKSKKKFCVTLLEKLKDVGSRTESEVIGSVILLIMNHFNEEPNQVFPVVEPGTEVNHVELKKFKEKYSMLIVIGESLNNCSHFALVADNTVLNDHISNDDIATGIGMFFGVYYVMNMHYPEKCPAFLEFLQRFVADINDDTTAEVNTKAMGLFNKISPLMWTQFKPAS